MLNAYDELERDMNELKNNIGRKINPNDTDAMRPWRERMRSTRERTLEDMEERASQLVEAAQRIRDRTYAGARVIEIVPIAEVSATKYNAELKGLSANPQTGSICKRLSAASNQPEPENERKEKIKVEKIVKVKKERKEAEDDDEKP